MATLTVNPPTYISYVFRQGLPAPYLVPDHVHSPAPRSKSRPARNTVSCKASRKRKKRGRPKKHWTQQAARQRKFNPHRLRRVEVANLFAADSFASKTGRRFTTFITIRWALTAHGEADIRRRWTALLNGLRIWADRQGFELAHCWAHECPPRGEPSFNTHLLINIPPDLREAAAAWLVKRLGGSAGAIDVQPRVCPGWNKPDDRVSYLCKGTDKATAIKFRLIRKHGWDYNQGFIPFQRSGTTRNINANARKAGGFSDTIKTPCTDFPAKYARVRNAA